MSQTLTAPRRALSAAPGAAPSVRSSASARSLPQRGTRLTLRGRVTLVALLALAGFALFALGQIASNALAADQSVASTSVKTTEWVVQPGETLWQIAESVAPDTDPRDTVARLVQLNDLANSSVRAGQTLLIPA
jgi:nucleoid-associated protein YgaU